MTSSGEEEQIGWREWDVTYLAEAALADVAQYLEVIEVHWKQGRRGRKQKKQVSV